MTRCPFGFDLHDQNKLRLWIPTQFQVNQGEANVENAHLRKGVDWRSNHVGAGLAITDRGRSTRRSPIRFVVVSGFCQLGITVVETLLQALHVKVKCRSHIEGDQLRDDQATD